MQTIVDSDLRVFLSIAIFLCIASSGASQGSDWDPIQSLKIETWRQVLPDSKLAITEKSSAPTIRRHEGQKHVELKHPGELSLHNTSMGNRTPADRLDAQVLQPIIQVQHQEDSPSDLRSAKGEFIFNFQAAPWDIVLTRFAAEAKLALQMKTVPPGTFNHIDSNSYTPAQALDILNGNLLQIGFLLLRNDHFLIVYPTSEEIPVHLIPQVDVEDLKSRGRNELVRTLLRLENVNAVAASSEIEPILSQFGSSAPLASSNHLVVTDLAQNVRQIHRVLQLGEGDLPRRPSIVVKLKNTPAVEVAKAVNDFLAGRPSGGAPQDSADIPNNNSLKLSEISVVPEPHTESLIVSAPPRDLALLERLIAELDAAPAQVIIQVLLVEVELDKTDEFGVELGIQDSVLFDRSVINNIVTVSETVTNGLVQTTNQSIISQEAAPGFAFNNAPLGNNTAIRPGTLGGQGLASFGVGRTNSDLGYGGLVLSAGSESISVLLRALAARRNVDILSRPQIRTIHNRPAQIQIGQQVPVVDGVSVTAVGSANPIIRQDKAGIILDVTPRINPDGTVVIDVDAEKSAFQTGPGSGIPIFTDATNGNVIEAPIKDITSAVATVSVSDGQTIVLGGMIINNSVSVERKVPFLGDVPYLGRLFRHDLQTTNRRELLIFLTPQVIFNAADSDAISATETERICLPHSAALQMHGPLLPDYQDSSNETSPATPKTYEHLPPANGNDSPKLPADDDGIESLPVSAAPRLSPPVVSIEGMEQR